jgi:hypothetical protein
MNAFIEEFRTKLSQIQTSGDLELVYAWLYSKQDSVAKTALELNTVFNLTDDYELQPDLPCFTVGSTKGLVVLAANPGWDVVLNKKENDYCTHSPENYIDMMVTSFINTRSRSADTTRPGGPKQ